MDISKMPWFIQKKIYFFVHQLCMREVRAEIENCIFFVYARENRKSPYHLSWWYCRNRNYYYALTLDDYA